MTGAPIWTDVAQAWTGVVSAGADIATAVIAAVGFSQLLRQRDKADPQHLSIWKQTALIEHGKVEVDLFIVNLLPEPALLQLITAGPGVEVGYTPVDYRTPVQRHQDRQAGVPAAEPVWCGHVAKELVLPGYRPEGGYKPVDTFLVRSDGGRDRWLEVKIAYASGNRAVAIRRLKL